jgi:hypothetical protein
MQEHRRAVRFFWSLLIGATLVSLTGNITHAVLRYIPHVVIQIGVAAVPPIALLAAVHGIALTVRAGASGRVYVYAISSVAAIGTGAFAMSFLALRDLMRTIGYSSMTAWIFPTIVDTAVAVSTLMLLALGDRPVHRARTAFASTDPRNKAVQPASRNAKVHVKQVVPTGAGMPTSVSTRPEGAYTALPLADTNATCVDGDAARCDADLASELIASGVPTQSAETVVAVLTSSRAGASINAAARASGINYRTAQRIVQAARQHQRQHFQVVS